MLVFASARGGRLTVHCKKGVQTMSEVWGDVVHRIEVTAPLVETRTLGLFDVHLKFNGATGGVSGRAGAARLAIARALMQARPNADVRTALEARFLNFADTRERLSKAPGKLGHYKRKHWAKR